jgi:indole-3-glycerol phosphate synthase
MILDRITAHKRLEVDIQKKHVPLDEIKRSLTGVDTTRGFVGAISAQGKVNLIAEIKKASPSRGVIRSDFDPEAIARTYEDNGAVAISVLTDSKFFQGDLSFLATVRSVTSSVPILRKDFIIDEYQIYQSRLAGADAVLLIAATLDLATLERFLGIAHDVDLDCLVEVHTEDELGVVLNTSASIIGINNRDLRTFRTDIRTTAHLGQMVPKDRVLVSESGISSKEDVEFLRQCGVQAMLVGESLMRSDDIGLKLRQLISP